MTFEKANLVYDILVATCGAPEHDRESFVFDQTGESPAREWRFQGSLGFGGKFWRETCRVSYYPEDKTVMREAMVQAANKNLAGVGGVSPPLDLSTETQGGLRHAYSTDGSTAKHDALGRAPQHR